MNIYILGGNGFVGSGFVRLFQRLGLEHQVLSRENYPAFVGSSCDVFINANGNSSKILASRQPLADFEANVRSTRASLEDFKAGFYIHLSSCDVYPDCSSPLSTQEDAPIALGRQSPYGFHKLLAEQCIQHACKNWLIVRQGGFVGPGLKKNAIFDILNGGPLWLNPESELQFLHTDDSAQLIWSLYEQGVANTLLNVCGQGVLKLCEALDLWGRECWVQPDSRLVRYEVSTDKVSRYIQLPDSRSTVLNFIHGMK
ncbi:MAG: NAD(P)-dependent oxidoreductase [Cystobacterineae bacterium]|nr:NAD(P)-dependent oxidoreductase [Cystobacterineae bacterium]